MLSPKSSAGPGPMTDDLVVPRDPSHQEAATAVHKTWPRSQGWPPEPSCPCLPGNSREGHCRLKTDSSTQTDVLQSRRQPSPRAAAHTPGGVGGAGKALPPGMWPVTGPSPAARGSTCMSLKPSAARPQLGAAGRPAPPYGGLGPVSFQRNFCCSRTMFPATEKRSVGARRAPRFQLSPEPGVWRQRRPRPVASALCHPGSSRVCLIPLRDAPDPTFPLRKACLAFPPSPLKNNNSKTTTTTTKQENGER